ncbi:isochorismate synthase [Nocardia inohanensis]|uniref:isochorismate synthase n=1 Tax=Nocardia inohanensis TaxID=209246 RepID=UPI000A01F160|nr:chorismate-binding protein [Nocardia inohanensis]
MESDPIRFRLCGPGGALALGNPIGFTNLSEAEAAVRTGRHGDLVAGAIPFDPASDTPSLYLGHRIVENSGGAVESTWGGFRPEVVFNDNAIAEYIELFHRVLPLLRTPGSGLEKIVIARSERFSYHDAVDPAGMYQRIAQLYPQVHSYFVEHLDAPGVYTMGASPELFLRKTGDVVTMTPLAGTVPRDAQLSEDADRAQARAELYTHKYLEEHGHLAEFMIKGLAALCTALEYPDEPELVAAPGVWHLGTPITGRLTDPDMPIAELVSALHPSPAVCGVPQAEALRLITAHESARRYYGGLVGWFDRAGDCEFYMALRGLEFDSRERHLTLRAGGGVVAGSRLATEFAETSAKLASMRRVLGITP